MQLIAIFAVFIFFIIRKCASEIAIDLGKSDEFAELEEASIKILSTCYQNQNKTVVVIGEFPDSYIKRLASDPTFSLVVMSYLRQTNYIRYDSTEDDQRRHHKVHIVVTISSYWETSLKTIVRYGYSRYANQMASVLILGWSPIAKSRGCGKRFNKALTLTDYNYNQVLNVNFICHDLKKGLVLHTSNPYTNHSLDPWISDKWTEIPNIPSFPKYSYFVREYREDREMCKNLHFDKTLDLAGLPIPVIYLNDGGVGSNGEILREFSDDRREKIQQKKRFSFIRNFIKKIKATYVNLVIKTKVGVSYYDNIDCIHAQPAIMRGVDTKILSNTYPHGLECKFLVSQFRGNKTQLEKIYSVIDSNSWIGMYTVYLVTLIFFKFFLNQPLMVGILNLCRLTCNAGLPKLPSNGSPQIYLACLLFFVVTMQGIFMGKLASLLTHDFPVRQVNSIKDLADLGYTVLLHESDFVFFDNPVFNGRLVKTEQNEDCLQRVLQNVSIACLTWGATSKVFAIEKNLHVSPGCVISENVVTLIPWRWALEEKINTYLGISIAADIMMPLHDKVDEKRLLEAESAEILLGPEIMTFKDLAFAFVILGIGLGCASIIFIIELMIDRYNRRIMKTRVIVLK